MIEIIIKDKPKKNKTKQKKHKKTDKIQRWKIVFVEDSDCENEETKKNK